MSFYLTSVDAADEHHWQRYNIALDGASLAEARAYLEIEATDLWSFREIHSSHNDTMLLDSIYVFSFRNACDTVVFREFDTSRRRALVP